MTTKRSFCVAGWLNETKVWGEITFVLCDVKSSYIISNFRFLIYIAEIEKNITVLKKNCNLNIILIGV